MLYFCMTSLKEKLLALKKEDKPLFYNSSGNKFAYQLGVKHLSSAEFLGFADSLPNGDLRLRKLLILVNFEKNEIVEIKKGSRLKPIKLEHY